MKIGVHILWFFLLIFISGCKEKPVYFEVKCNADGDVDGNAFFVNGYKFNHAETRTDEVAYSGNSALKLNKDDQYGFTIKLSDLQVDDMYVIRVKRRSKEGNGLLVVSETENKKIYRQTDQVVENLGNGWELMELKFYVPPTISSGDQIACYVWNHKEAPVYFDDFEVHKVPHRFTKPSKDLPHLNLVMEKNDIEELIHHRINAFKKGVITEEEQDWVKCHLEYEGKNGVAKKERVKVRLKGDWLDHIIGPKWSFRIKFRDEASFNGMVEFSVQSPDTKGFLNEWVFHQALEHQDVLTTRYDFITLSVNGENRGVFAVEEHFVKQLVESRRRREGPILKVTEKPFWDLMVMYEQQVGSYTQPEIFAPTFIEPFKEKRILEDSTLLKQFHAAHTLLHQLKYGIRNPQEVIDVNRLAMYYALTDVFNAYHGFTWHNVRYYFNPITCKLEMIGYDGYSEKPIKSLDVDTIAGYVPFCSYEMPSGDKEDLMLFEPLENKKVLHAYQQNLYRFSDSTWLEVFLDSLEPKIALYESKIKEEYPRYQFDRGYFQHSAKNIRFTLPDFKALTDSCITDFYRREYALMEPCNGQIPLASVGVKGYTEGRNGKWTASIQNYHCAEAEVIGFGTDDSLIQKLNNPIVLIPYSYKSDSMLRVPMEKHFSRVYFKTNGVDSVLSGKLYPWKPPMKETPRQKLDNLAKNRVPAWVIKSDSKWEIPKGSYKLDHLLVIPEDVELHVKPGAQIEFTHAGGILSYAAVYMNGASSDRIRVFSKSNESSGVTVLQADGKSTVSYCDFNGLGTLDFEGWILTGSVTFYESEVELSNVSFQNNTCEDALNTVRSNFRLNDCKFEHIASDAFDGDFCTGTVSNTSFSDVYNDALDFSGSQISVRNVQITNTGDKGVSAGEESTIRISGATVNGAGIGLCAKDLSVIEADSCRIERATYGFAAYVKKGEFGSARLFVSATDTLNLEHNWAIEKGSVLNFNGKEIKGTGSIEVPGR